MAKPKTKLECLYVMCDRLRHKDEPYCWHHSKQYWSGGVQKMRAFKSKRKFSCSYKECESPAVSQLLCKKHFKIVKRGIKEFECSVLNCDHVAISSKKCHRHEIITRRYGVSAIQLSQMILKSNGLCELCDNPPGEKGLHIDHDRSCCDKIGSCGRCIRGMVCFRCNSGLSHFRDDPTLMQNAIDYLSSGINALDIEDKKSTGNENQNLWDKRWWTYKVGIRRFEYLMDIQDGVCGICKDTMTTPHIDHNHSTGAIRGLLCRECNLGLGDVFDSVKTIQNMIDYV